MEIVKYPAPSLLEKSTEVEFTSEIREFIEVMEAFIASDECPPAAGLAAPQVGVNCRIFWALGAFFVNPTITDQSSETYETEEGCLSLEPGKLYPVTRHRSVSVRYLDRKGHERINKFSDYQAQVIQHEYDHLEGRLINGEHGD